MFKSIRILLSITTHYVYEIWQIDVKTAFLNSNLEEEIYIMQSKGFIAKNQEHMILLDKYMFVSHTKHTQWKINGSTLFAIDNMYYVNLKI